MKIPHISPYRFFECGCCGEYHEIGSRGDCRDDATRYSYERLERLFGVNVWDSVLDLEEQERNSKELEDIL